VKRIRNAPPERQRHQDAAKDYLQGSRDLTSIIKRKDANDPDGKARHPRE
jgi:hypothetical protein